MKAFRTNESMADTPSDVPQDINFARILMRLRRSMATSSATDETETSISNVGKEETNKNDFQQNMGDGSPFAKLKRTIPLNDPPSKRVINDIDVNKKNAASSVKNSDFDRILQTLRRSMETKTLSHSTQNTDISENERMSNHVNSINSEETNETSIYLKENPSHSLTNKEQNNKDSSKAYEKSHFVTKSFENKLEALQETSSFTSKSNEAMSSLSQSKQKAKTFEILMSPPKWSNTTIILENDFEISSAVSKCNDVAKTLQKNKIPKTSDGKDSAGNDEEPLSKRQKISIKLPKMKAIPITQLATESDLDEDMESDKMNIMCLNSNSKSKETNDEPFKKIETESKPMPRIRVISLERLIEKKEVKVEEPKEDKKENSEYRSKQDSRSRRIEKQTSSLEFLKSCRDGRNNQTKSYKNEKNSTDKTHPRQEDKTVRDVSKIVDKNKTTKNDEKSKIVEQSNNKKTVNQMKQSSNSHKTSADKSSSQRLTSTAKNSEKEQMAKKALNQNQSSLSKSLKSSSDKSSKRSTSSTSNPYKSSEQTPPLSSKTVFEKKRNTDKSSRRNQSSSSNSGRSRELNLSSSSVPSKKRSSSTNPFKSNTTEPSRELVSEKDKLSNQKHLSQRSREQSCRILQSADQSSSMKLLTNEDANPFTQPHVVDDETHKRMVERFLRANDKNDKKSDRKDSHVHSSHARSSHIPPRSSRASRSPIRSSKNLKSPTKEKPHDPALWSKYCRRVDDKLRNLKLRYEKYKTNPEKHPSYEDEWQEFWEKRKSELMSQGKDYRTYDYKAEWVPYFEKRINIFYEEAFEALKIALREELSLPFSNKYIRNPKYFVKHVEHKIDIKSNSVKESKISIASVALSPHTMGIIANSVVEETPTFVGVLNLLMKHEDDLGRFKEKVVNLLAKALQAEILGPIEEIALINDENCTLLEAIAEKFKGLIILDKSKEKSLMEAISKVQMFLEVAFKLKEKTEELALKQFIETRADTVQVADTAIANFHCQQPHPMVDYTGNVYDQSLDWQQQQILLQQQQQMNPIQPQPFMDAYDWNQDPNQTWGIGQWAENGPSMGPGPINQNYFC